MRIADKDVQASLSRVPKRAHADDESARPVVGAGSRFEKLRPHAEGGLGQIFVARDNELRREVALKEIQPLLADDADSQAQFLIEAEITGGLEHPGI
jgi:eukaryotic-like serine/threonine-protein kinase